MNNVNLVESDCGAKFLGSFNRLRETFPVSALLFIPREYPAVTTFCEKLLLHSRSRTENLVNHCSRLIHAYVAKCKRQNPRPRIHVTEGLWFGLRPEAPRGGLNPNRGFVELGAFRTKRLRRLPHIEMFKWNSILDQIRVESEWAVPKRDRMRLARYYQSLFDTGEVKTRAELARYMGVSRARVTQVLKRLG